VNLKRLLARPCSAVRPSVRPTVPSVIQYHQFNLRSDIH